MWKRLTLSITVAAAVVSLVAGASFALFTASTGNSNNSFTAGTVTLNQTASTLADVGPLVPGDSSSKTLDVTYTGNVNAWLGLVFTVNDPATGTSLRTCSSNAFAATVTTGSSSFSANPGVQTIGLVTPNDAKTYSLNYSLPLATGNGCQGATAKVQVNICAVQADQNTTGAGPTSWGACGTAATSSFVVPVNITSSAGSDTGADIQVGDQVTIVNSGLAGIGDTNTWPPQNGSGHNNAGDTCYPGMWLGQCLPGGALLGRIGNGAWFLVGHQTTFTASTSGRLYLAINDLVWGGGNGAFADNQGSWVATVTVGP